MHILSQRTTRARRHEALPRTVIRMKTLIGFGTVALCLATSACGSGCKNYVLERTTSPGAEWDAVAFVRGCGATTRPTANVSLVRSGDELPDEPGNLLIVDEPAVMAEKRGDIHLRWESPHTLAVALASSRNAVHRVAAHDGVVVRYVERD